MARTSSSARDWTVPRVGLLVGLPLSLLLSLSMPQLGNGRLWDALNRTLPTKITPRVVVVGIDDQALRDYGPPEFWPRELYAQVLSTLNAGGALAIGLDLQPDNPGLLATIGQAVTEPAGQAGIVVGTASSVAPAAGHGAEPEGLSTGLTTLLASRDGIVRSYQTALGSTAAPQASFAWQLARLAGKVPPLDTRRRLIRLTSPDPGLEPALPLRSVVNGTLGPAAVQGRVVLLGDTGRGAPTVRGPYHRQIPQVQMQARLVTSLLSAPFVMFPQWLTALLGALILTATVLLRRLWGFWLAFALLALSPVLWLAGILLPAVTFSLCAALGAGLVAAERAWTLRRLRAVDPLTGFGNRVALTRALEARWRRQGARPLGLLLVELGGVQEATRQYGPEAADELLIDLAGRLGRTKRRNELLFRWSANEFALLLGQDAAESLTRRAEELRQGLEPLTFRDVPLQASIGVALADKDMRSSAQLVEAARRDRTRARSLSGSGT
ncbi:CHASE2 domain-containing protein [Deinococcus navajonensis]|uniref:CHASE2 domain-containing protein n=1 Tax=Deinococcus navajonensis TaxID=309884 RepID=A0ABV8XNW8_9DEIO